MSALSGKAPAMLYSTAPALKPSMHHAGFRLSVGAFLYFLLLFFLDLCLFTYFGQFLVFLTPSQGFAQIIASGELLVFAQLKLCFCWLQTVMLPC